MDAKKVRRYMSGYVAERIKRFILVAIALLLGLLFMPSAIKSVPKQKPQAEVNSSVIEKVVK
jgi:hypothetical protein